MNESKEEMRSGPGRLRKMLTIHCAESVYGRPISFDTWNHPYVRDLQIVASLCPPEIVKALGRGHTAEPPLIEVADSLANCLEILLDNVKQGIGNGARRALRAKVKEARESIKREREA